MSVVTEAAESDDRPRRERGEDDEAGRGRRRGEAARQREPEQERPEEDLQHDRGRQDAGGRPQPVAEPPRRCEREEQERADGVERHADQHRLRQEGDAVAPPIADADDVQRGGDGGCQQEGEQGCGDGERQERERRHQERRRCRIDERLLVRQHGGARRWIRGASGGGRRARRSRRDGVQTSSPSRGATSRRSRTPSARSGGSRTPRRRCHLAERAAETAAARLPCRRPGCCALLAMLIAPPRPGARCRLGSAPGRGSGGARLACPAMKAEPTAAGRRAKVVLARPSGRFRRGFELHAGHEKIGVGREPTVSVW